MIVWFRRKLAQQCFKRKAPPGGGGPPTKVRIGGRSDVVAELALDLACRLLCFALAFLALAFLIERRTVIRDRLLGVVDRFVGEALGLVLQLAHGL